MRIIRLELNPSGDSYQIGELAKSPFFLSAIAVVDEKDVPVKIKVDRHENTFFDEDGKIIYRWSIDRLIMEMKVDPGFSLGELKVFDEPPSFKELGIPDGEYLCKYFCTRDMRVDIGILHLSNVGSIDGMFLFDLNDYHVLSVQEILNESP